MESSDLLPRVHLHQGVVSRERLDYYLDEFTFRFDGTRLAGGSSSCASPNKPWLWGRRYTGQW